MCNKHEKTQIEPLILSIGDKCPCCGETLSEEDEEVGGHHPMTNHYECDCGCVWSDAWCAGVDDECPDCGADVPPKVSFEWTKEYYQKVVVI